MTYTIDINYPDQAVSKRVRIPHVPKLATRHVSSDDCGCDKCTRKTSDAIKWKEEEHPRASSGEHGGQFTSGSGGSTSKSTGPAISTPASKTPAVSKGTASEEPKDVQNEVAEGATHPDTTPSPIEQNTKSETFSKSSPPPKELNGVTFSKWDAPTTKEGWLQLAGDEIDEPELPSIPKHKGLGSGVIIQEPDGRVWLAKPTNSFGGYQHTFPKGGVEDGLTPQANALKEAYEETGLHVKITGVAGDVNRSTSVARYYFATRVGGSPADHGWESEGVTLSSADDLLEHLNMPVDQKMATKFLGTKEPPMLKMSDMTKVGKQLGSNPGGQYTDKNGKKYYVKQSKSEAHAKNEILASKLYEAAGAPILKAKPVDVDGKLGTATEWKEGVKLIDTKDPKQITEAQRHFATHAWLANWDAAGLEYDNQGVVNGKMTTLDPGGSLLFRAQGGPKGKAFGDKVTEWDSLRDKSNTQAHKIFGSMTPKQLKRSAENIALPDKVITDLVDQHGPGSAEERKALGKRLLLRRDDILARSDATHDSSELDYFDNRRYQRSIVESLERLANAAQEEEFFGQTGFPNTTPAVEPNAGTPGGELDDNEEVDGGEFDVGDAGFNEAEHTRGEGGQFSYGQASPAVHKIVNSADLRNLPGKTKLIPLSKITATIPHVMSEKTVSQLQLQRNNPSTVPRPKLLHHKGEYGIIDGHHRIEAMHRNNQTHVAADVVESSKYFRHTYPKQTIDIHYLDAFEEGKHPRGQPENKGEFAKGGGGGGTTAKTAAPGSTGAAPVSKTAHLIPAPTDRNKWPAHAIALKVPPGWGNVQISSDPNAALQAIGQDSKGRKQYIYNKKFSAGQSEAKYAKIKELEQQFDAVQKENNTARKSKDNNISEHADVAALLMTMGIRPGGEGETGGAVKAFGATTLEGKHVVQLKSGMRLRFTGKKGVKLDLPVEDPELAKMLFHRATKSGPGGQLFPKVSDGSLLAYMHTLDGGKFRSKDVRTLLASKTAMSEVAKMPEPKNEATYKKQVKVVATIVAAKLGNTATVSLQSYIPPEVFVSWRASAGV